MNSALKAVNRAALYLACVATLIAQGPANAQIVPDPTAVAASQSDQFGPGGAQGSNGLGSYSGYGQSNGNGNGSGQGSGNGQQNVNGSSNGGLFGGQRRLSAFFFAGL